MHYNFPYICFASYISIFCVIVRSLIITITKEASECGIPRKRMGKAAQKLLRPRDDLMSTRFNWNEEKLSKRKYTE